MIKDGMILPMQEIQGTTILNGTRIMKLLNILQSIISAMIVIISNTK